MIRNLFFIVSLIASVFACADEIVPDGKMLVSFELINGEEVATEAVLLLGETPPPGDTRGVPYKIYASSGGLLFSGKVNIDRRIFHDKSETDGSLIGKVTYNSGKVTVALPWYRNASSLELDGRVASRADLQNIRQRRVVKAANIYRNAKEAEYGKYLDSLFVREPHQKSATKTLAHDSLAEVSPAKKTKVRIETVVEDLTDQEKENLSVEITVFDNINWSTISKKTIYPFARPGKANLRLKPGSYILYAECKIGEKTLYPGYQYLNDFNTDFKKATFCWENTKHVKTTVVASGGTKLKSKVTILENKYNGSTRQLSRIIKFTDDNGYLEMWLPPRSMTFVVEPFDRLAASAAVKVKKIKNKKRGSQKFKITLPEYKAVGGNVIKKIWDSGSDGKRMNFIFLSDAYTNLVEPFIDTNGNGLWDGDLLLDENGNLEWDEGERYIDRNYNDVYDKPEPFTDTNGDQMCNRYERAEFELTAAMMTAVVMNFEPFKSYSDKMNVYTYWTPSTHGAQKMPGFPAPWKNMDTFYQVECQKDDFYGDRGKFNLYSSANYTTINRSVSTALPGSRFYVLLVRDPFNIMVSNSAILQSAADTRGGLVLIHEMGHKVGGLADEYIYSGDSWKEYPNSFDYHMPNLTFISDPATAKWSHLLDPNLEVPTPPGTEGYGLYEGGSWAKGIYRPTNYSMMRSSAFPFFKVNEEALIEVLEKYK